MLLYSIILMTFQKLPGEAMPVEKMSPITKKRGTRQAVRTRCTDG